MNFGWHILPGVELRGLQPQAVLIMQAMADTYRDHGYDCWFTSVVRPGDPGFHGLGLGVDSDASVELDNSTWAKLKLETQRKLGPDFQIIVHKTPKGRMHMHGEFDPGGKGVEAYKNEAGEA